jgi:anti-anti-sigma factor
VTGLAALEAHDLSGARLVRVRGEVDLSNIRDVMEGIRAAVTHEATLVVLDLSGTTYLDSTGIAMVFRLAERLGHRRQELRLVVPADAPIRRALELTRVTTFLPVHETVTAAVRGTDAGPEEESVSDGA